MPSVRLVGFVEHGWGDRAQQIDCFFCTDDRCNYNVFESFISIHLMGIMFMLIVSSMNHGIANLTCLMMSYCVIFV